MKPRKNSINLTPQEFSDFRDFINVEIGLHLTSQKKSLVLHRLSSRIQELGLPGFKEYLSYVRSNTSGAENERQFLFDKITTHTTRFFRESKQFELLQERLLPDLIKSKAGSSTKKLTIWSAGCSTGEEAYTLAMVLEQFKRDQKAAFDYKITANDISRKVIQVARKGIYGRDVIRQIPKEYRKRYIQHGTGPFEAYVRVHPQIKRNITFHQNNLMNPASNPEIACDMILCRNTMIYFSRASRQQLINRFIGNLHKGGYLLTSFTESLHDIDSPLIQLSPSIYKLPDS